jgi:hypothetical protein
MPVPYRKWQHLFRFHSWMPFYADIEAIQDDPLSIKPGFTLMSQNSLSTLVSSFGYEYSDSRHKLHYGIKWLGWYLVFETRMDFGNSLNVEKFNNPVADPSGIANGYALTNTVSLPLSFRGGRFTKYLYLMGSSTFTNDYIYLAEKGGYDKGQNELTGRFYFSNYQRSAVRDIHPRLAQVMDLSYSSYPFDKKIYGNIFTARSAFYFPGFLNNNGLKLRLEAERQDPVRFLLGSRSSFSRGYEKELTKEIRFFSADYFMPLFYPEINISSILYVKRVRTNLFYDFTRIPGKYVFTVNARESTLTYQEIPESFKSYGIELISDFYLFRIPFMMSGGIQASWRSFGEYPYLKLLFNIDIYGMSIGKRLFKRNSL